MAQYIDKDALVAEIKRQILAIDNTPKITDTQISVLSGNKVILTKLLSFIDTLEMKELDVWHEASEMPKGAGDKEILVQFADSHASVLEIDDWEYLDHQTKWAYLKDLI